jgi:hypothetical protein
VSITESHGHFRIVAFFENDFVFHEWLLYIGNVAGFGNTYMFLDKCDVFNVGGLQFGIPKY